jgi:hypothetical protein
MQDHEVYLSNKHVILSSGGTKYNDLYYHHMNSTAALVECTYSMGKYSQSLSSLGFGSTSNVTIPNQSFLGETYLQLVLPNTTANQTICRGWGYACIQEIQYIIGSSNTSTITLSGESVFSTVLAQCTSEEKRSELFRLAGQEILVPQIAPANGDVPQIRADVLLPYPWSTMCDKLDLDTSLLSNNIVITIKFKPSNSIYGGSDAEPQSFLSALVTFRQGDLSNTNLSLRHTMMANPELIYSYPLSHFQNFQSPPFPGATLSQGLAACQVNLQGFINSDLTGIYFYVVKQLDVFPSGSNSPSPFHMDPITNVRLYYNGIPLYLTNGELYKLINMVGHQDASFFENSVIRPGAVAPFNSDPVDSYLIFIDFARLRTACYPNHFANTFRISNQTLQLQFNTSLNNTINYICYATYVYNGICEFKNGQSFIYFD